MTRISAIPLSKVAKNLYYLVFKLWRVDLGGGDAGWMQNVCQIAM